MLSLYQEQDRCEWLGGCSDTFGLANAHRLKKTKITIEEEYIHGRAKLCKHHHDFVEHQKDHALMWNFVTRIIRSLRPEVPIPLFELPEGRYIGSDWEIYLKY
jgi:hypothetical protein